MDRDPGLLPRVDSPFPIPCFAVFCTVSAGFGVGWGGVSSRFASDRDARPNTQGTMPMTISKQQRDSDWTRHHYLALHIVREGLRYESGDMPPDVDERIDEAMAHAWLRFERICEKYPDAPAKSRVRWAAKTGVSRVKSGRKVVRTRQRCYVDAMDRTRDEDSPVDMLGHTIATGYRDPSDNTLAELIITTLPDHLKPVARLLSYGMTKELAAERRGISRTTLYTLIGELRELVSAALPEPIPVEPEAEPVRKFCPVRALLTAIGIEHEHNRCYRPDVIVHADPFTGDIVLENRR